MADLRVRSEIAGSVWKIEVAVGDSVAEDDPLVILELMKMEIPLLAPRSGIVKEILVAEGEPIAEGDIAVILGDPRQDRGPARDVSGLTRQWRVRCGSARKSRGKTRRSPWRRRSTSWPARSARSRLREPASADQPALWRVEAYPAAPVLDAGLEIRLALLAAGAGGRLIRVAEERLASAIGWPRTAGRFRRCASGGFSCMARTGPERGAARRDRARNRRGDRVRHRRASLDARRSAGARRLARRRRFRRPLDIGTGTGVLAIAAAKRAAPHPCWRATSIAPPRGSPRTMSGATVCAAGCA